MMNRVRIFLFLVSAAAPACVTDLGGSESVDREGRTKAAVAVAPKGGTCDPSAWVYMGDNPSACEGRIGESCGWTSSNEGQGYHCQATSWGAGCEPGGQTCSGGGSSGDWSGFTYPTVSFTDQATALEGSQIIRNAIPNIIQVMKDQCMAVCKTLYADNNDPRVPFSKLNLILQDNPNGVAGKWGNGDEIWIGVSAQYIARFYHANGNRDDLLLQEIRGMLTHEVTHGYQWNPKNCGAYDGSSVFWALIEGEADGVRAELTNWVPTNHPVKGGSWNGGYSITGFFLDWCKHNKKSTFFIELNHAARDMATFTWDGAFQQILGQSVQSAWNEYQASLP